MAPGKAHPAGPEARPRDAAVGDSGGDGHSEGPFFKLLFLHVLFMRLTKFRVCTVRPRSQLAGDFRAVSNTQILAE